MPHAKPEPEILGPDVLGPEADDTAARDAKAEAADQRRVRDGFWTTFKRAAGQVPFARDVAAAYYCAFDPVTPRRVRLTILAALGYFVLPADALPDFIVGFGFTDDATVLATTIALVASHMKPEHRAAADAALKD
jgi:uncharacterized membrane protein YkvA (DUF1232 family)